MRVYEPGNGGPIGQHRSTALPDGKIGQGASESLPQLRQRLSVGREPAVIDAGEMIARASANSALLDGTLHPLETIIADYDLVLGIWEDASAPERVGRVVIKGKRRLASMPANGLRLRPHAQETRWTAILCHNLEHADAMREVLGESE